MGFVAVCSRCHDWLRRGERYRRLLWGLLPALTLLVLVVVLVDGRLPPRRCAVAASPEAVQGCRFHVVTGLPCPLCGLTRGSRAVLRGRWRESWRWHPVAGYLCALLALAAVAGGIGAWRGRVPRPLTLLLIGAAALLPILLALNWFARLAAG